MLTRLNLMELGSRVNNGYWLSSPPFNGADADSE